MKKNMCCFIVAVLFSCVFILSGCIPLVIGSAFGLSVEKTDGYIPGNFINGILVKELKNSPLQVYQAVKSVFKKSKITLVREQYDLHYAAVLGYFPDGQEVVVNVEEIKPFISKIKIRVGDLGDERLSDNILRAIMKEL